ncbi:PQQ-binding-like beta-propeller repeat protein [Streptomyces liangshanensis]|uniref:PQQ-binding-like beta-propeller repeat protein n=1 Tax=Streptomyces liangshanensis TaxID=2717324 RepID=A0A6G9H754_9ACTN|nr:PQQ-binding-like beta-propeller repeat protein [Streptomyces liangshanensis]QIQ06378.1 PQQ-binding-like beta-propeller repeat protein [Streptomyces liangshanensis]
MGAVRARWMVSRVAGVLLLVLAAGCGGASAKAGPGAPAGWRTWAVRATGPEPAGRCLPTERLLVCPAAPAGVVARSASTGEVVWSVGAGKGRGRNTGAAVDGDRAVSAGGRTLRAADLADGRAAWTRTLPAGRAFGPPAVSDGRVYAVAHGPAYTDPQTLLAYRASDGKLLWQRDTTTITPFARGGRVITFEVGGRAVARDGRTGEVVAASDPAHPCPSLISAPGRLVCTEERTAAGDTFPPLVRVDPATLRFTRTLWRPDDKPSGGVISPDGVLVLRTVNAEDPSTGRWIALDLTTGKTLWRTEGPEDGDGNDTVVLAGTRAVWIAGGRLVSVDPRKGPYATGADAPRRSPAYPEAAGRRSPLLVAYGTHLVVQARTGPGLRSVTAP